MTGIWFDVTMYDVLEPPWDAIEVRISLGKDGEIIYWLSNDYLNRYTTPQTGVLLRTGRESSYNPVMEFFTYKSGDKFFIHIANKNYPKEIMMGLLQSMRERDYTENQIINELETLRLL